MRVFACSSTVCLAAALAGLLLIPACASGPALDPSNPDVAAYLELVGPKKLELQRFLTRPEASQGSGDPDHISVVVAARDALEDSVKVLGTFHFELHTMRLASSDKLDRRLAAWQIPIDSEKALLEHWDRLSGYYRFPLELPMPSLPANHYVLTARLVSALGTTLFDEYAFQYPPPAAR